MKKLKRHLGLQKGAMISACGIPKVSIVDAELVNCRRCQQTKAYKRKTISLVWMIVVGNEERIEADVSDKACMEFGFKHGDVVVTPHKETATIIGVGESGKGKRVLWYLIEHTGKVYRNKGPVYWGHYKNLKKEGFRLKRDVLKEAKEKICEIF